MIEKLRMRLGAGIGSRVGSGRGKVPQTLIVAPAGKPAHLGSPPGTAGILLAHAEAGKMPAVPGRAAYDTLGRPEPEPRHAQRAFGIALPRRPGCRPRRG